MAVGVTSGDMERELSIDEMLRVQRNWYRNGFTSPMHAVKDYVVRKCALVEMVRESEELGLYDELH